MPVVSEEFIVQVERFAEAARREAARRSEGASFVQRTPGVCGGDACVRNTRVPVWAVIQMLQMGRTKAEVLADLPSMIEPDLDVVWAYYRSHLAEIEANIAENDDESL